ncbi:hypothetical protein GBAR_LOCUS9043, partial [Geodia barretti]
RWRERKVNCGSQPRGRERVNFDSQQTEEKGFELTLVCNKQERGEGVNYLRLGL